MLRIPLGNMEHDSAECSQCEIVGVSLLDSYVERAW